MKKAVFAGSFDPFTNGHFDIVKRSLKIFDEIIILVAINENKKSLFSLDERVNMIKETVQNLKKVTVDSYQGYTVEYAKNHQAQFLIRGIRDENDFRYEIKLEQENLKLDENITTVFLFSRKQYRKISSTTVKKDSASKKDISELVPHSVLEKIKNK